MAEAEAPTKSFRITTKRMEFEPNLPNTRGQLRPVDRMYLFTFVIESTGVQPEQSFEMPVWVSANLVDPNDVVRAARHQLLLDLERLAQVGQRFRIPGEEIGTVFQTD